jgi:hypothetical protein
MKAFRNAYKSTIFLKVSSLIIGFALWSSICELFPRSQWLAIPISFYNRDSRTIQAPEIVQVEVTGKRSHISRIDKNSLAAHIDAQSLRMGDNLLTITHEHLLLPAIIAVTTVIPQSIVVRVAAGSKA